MSIKLDMQTNVFIKALGMRGNALQRVAAETINDAAEGLDKRYKFALEKNQTIRTKFTTNAPKLFKASPVRRSGEPRQLGKINAIYGVRKMKGGKDHYLVDLEEGVTRRGNSKTQNRVPVPLNQARTGQSPNKPIAGPNRLTKGNTQTLRAGGKVIGVRRDKYKSSAARFATIYNYKRRGGAGLQGDLSKPFFFIDNQNDLGIFKFVRNRMRKIRTLTKSSTRTKSRPHFGRAVKRTKPENMQRDFIQRAQDAIRGIR